MAFISWNEEMNVGVAAVDDDHQKMVGLINQLYDGMQEGRDRESISVLLDHLVECCQNHFAAEDALLEKADYLDAAIHAREHKETAAWAAKTREQFRDGTISTISPEMLVYIKDWLFDHILDSDKLFGPYLNSKGIF